MLLCNSITYEPPFMRCIHLEVALAKCQEISCTACSSCSVRVLSESRKYPVRAQSNNIELTFREDQLYLTSYRPLHASIYLFGILKSFLLLRRDEDSLLPFLPALSLICLCRLFRSTVVTVCLENCCQKLLPKTVANDLQLFARLASHLNHLDGHLNRHEDYLKFQS